MATITIEVPDELKDQLDRMGDRLPELLSLSLKQPAVPAQIYRYILNFIAREPTKEQIAAFCPTPEITDRLQTLLARSNAGELTSSEKQELDEYERIEHLMIMLKTSHLYNHTSQSEPHEI